MSILLFILFSFSFGSDNTNIDIQESDEVNSLELSILSKSFNEEVGLITNLHDPFNRLLQSYVDRTGNVDYTGLKKVEDRLDAYLNDLKTNAVERSWSTDRQLAYWINAYNAFTIKLILSNYPTESITSLENGKPWDKKWIELGGEMYSLNDIENNVIRPEFNEPRIHFAVNCAARSCPPLLNQAYTEKNLNRQLESQTAAFINNETYNVIKDGHIQVSKIFDWYKEDFGDLHIFLKKYFKGTMPESPISFKTYDWSLNGK